MEIYCCGCGKDTQARLTTGKEVYRNQEYLHELYFWKCDTCKNFVGTHKGSKHHAPLGVIPTPGIKKMRQFLHNHIDSMWGRGKSLSRGQLYAAISRDLGYPYHTANIKSEAEGMKVYRIIKKIKEQIS
jgi:hypothetical protein